MYIIKVNFASILFVLGEIDAISICYVTDVMYIIEFMGIILPSILACPAHPSIRQRQWVPL